MAERMWYKAQMLATSREQWLDLPLLTGVRTFGLRDEAESFAKTMQSPGTTVRTIECNCFGEACDD